MKILWTVPDPKSYRSNGRVEKASKELAERMIRLRQHMEQLHPTRLDADESKLVR